jgi:hypothetical protein
MRLEPWNVNLSTVESLRAVFLSFLAPINFFYNCFVTKDFSTPIFFLLILLIGYSFGILSAVISENKFNMGLFIMAVFFILASFGGKLFYTIKKNNKIK